MKQRVIGFTRGCYSINAQQREESKSRGRGKKSLVIEPRGKFQPCGKTELTTRIVKKKLKKKKGQKGGREKKREAVAEKREKGDKSVFPANTRGRRDRNFLVPSPPPPSSRGTVNRTKILIGGCQEGEGGKKERCRGKTVERRNRAKLSTSLVIRRFYSRKGGFEREKKKRFERYVNYEGLQAFYQAQGKISLIFHVSRACFHRLYSRDRNIILRSEFRLFEFSFSKGTGGNSRTRAPPLTRALRSTTFSPARCLKIFFPPAKIPEDGTRPNVKFRLHRFPSFSRSNTIFAVAAVE